MQSHFAMINERGVGSEIIRSKKIGRTVKGVDEEANIGGQGCQKEYVINSDPPLELEDSVRISSNSAPEPHCAKGASPPYAMVLNPVAYFQGVVRS
jgi:hypothetical protein